MLDISTATFWIAVLQIIAIDIMLGGDNAVVIALACRKLPDAQRKKGIFWGVAGAIGLRVALIFFALQLLAVPWLKIVGAVLLFWIGVKLLQPENEGHGDVAAATTLSGAIKTIIVADAVMSLDNVIAVAGAAPLAAYPGATRATPMLPYLALPRMGFAVPVLLPVLRWALTRPTLRLARRQAPPFHPCLIPCGPSAVCFLFHFPSALCCTFRRLTAPGR
jgi:YjbE family integral membrane protein